MRHFCFNFSADIPDDWDFSANDEELNGDTFAEFLRLLTNDDKESEALVDILYIKEINPEK